ncbi:hypothetical protein GCM10011529_11790 [Polymorphobacter glacialis]|uniref:Uncharacterized protein n=1 Tax=Sandarakinorhabdus glacialis TaxID=1614636 RepID=A0A917E5L9_9SPHN|nr:hypothetical protein [Polymorphobacter glacialis]GGE07035.1 hypothetical protein GCM10011529_11790 [Polymorphobacter glacialis]
MQLTTKGGVSSTSRSQRAFELPRCDRDNLASVSMLTAPVDAIRVPAADDMFELLPIAYIVVPMHAAYRPVAIFAVDRMAALELLALAPRLVGIPIGLGLEPTIGSLSDNRWWLRCHLVSPLLLLINRPYIVTLSKRFMRVLVPIRDFMSRHPA